MSNHNIITALAVAIALTAGASVCAASDFSSKSQSEISIEGQTAIYIECINGSVTIIGEDRDDLLLKINKKGTAGSNEEAEEMLKMMELAVKKTDETVIFEATYPKKFNAKRNLISYLVKRHPKMGMDVELFMPKGMDASVTIASGKIVVKDLRSQVEVNSAEGMVEIRDVEGKVTAVVASGRLDVADIKGSVDLQVVSGVLNATDVTGDAVVEVNSGTIEFAHLGGDLDCSIEYGKVVVDGVSGLKFEGISAHASFTGVRGAIDASTASGEASFRVNPEADVNYNIIASSGDITVRFLKKMAGGYILKAGTTSGEISVTLPIDVKNVGRNNITGVVREGKARIFLETASGDIIIEEPEE